MKDSSKSLFKWGAGIAGVLSFFVGLAGGFMPAIGLGLLGAFFSLPGVGLYFLPWLVANERSHHNGTAIFMLNLLTGWTFVGWVIAVVWANTATKQAPDAPAVPSAPEPRWLQPQSQHKACPFCGEEVLRVAIKCKHCHSDLSEAALSKPV